MTPAQMKEFTILMNAVTVDGDSSHIYALQKAGYCHLKDGKHIIDRKRLIADLEKDPKNLRFRTEGVGKVTYFTILKYLINTI